jgi:hypothetical protein
MMRERSSNTKRPRDLNQLAANIVGDATSDEPTEVAPASEKNPHAAALGRLGGKKGGPARALKLSASRRSEIARIAALARWHDKQEMQEGG